MWWCRASRTARHVAILFATQPSFRILLDFCARAVFWPDFRGWFWRSFGIQNRSFSIASESSQCLLSNGIKFAWIGVRRKKLWLLEVGVPELFFRVFLAKIPVDRGKPPANQELHIVAGVIIFPTHPGSLINSLWVEKTLRAKAVVWEKNASNLWLVFPYFLSVFAHMFDLAPDVGFRRSWYRWKACVTLFLTVPCLRETELGLERYGPANKGHQSVFGPSEGIFPIEIPARLGRILTIWEFHAVSEHVLFPMHLGSQINLLWAKKTLCASVTLSRGKLWNFQHSLISSACFRACGRYSSRCRISAILVSPESLCYLLSKSIGLAERRTWVRKIWSCEQRPLECSLCQGVIFWSRFRLDRRSSWRSGSCLL